MEQVAFKLSEFSIQHSSLPTYWVASDGRFLRVNEAGCKQLGYTEAELLTLSVADVNPDFTAERWPSHWQELRTRRLMIVETRQRHKDGCIVFVEAELNWFEFEGREYGFAFCRDLTARKQAEAAMRESEERYTALFERSHDCVFICDYTGKFLDANPAALALLGYQRADIATQTFASLLTEDQIARAFQVMEEIKTTGQQRKPAEFKVRHRDGRLIPVETQASLIYREGNPYAIQGIARDLTEHRRTEAALEQERNLLRTLIDHIPDMIYVRDKANRFLTANQSFARRMGVATAADLIGKTDADFYPAELAAQYAARDQKIFAGNELLNYDCVIPFPNGEHLSVLNTKVPLKNAQGEVIGLVGVSHDLTERKQMEQALRDSEAFYHSLVDQMPAGVFRKGPDGPFSVCQPRVLPAQRHEGGGISGQNPNGSRRRKNGETRGNRAGRQVCRPRRGSSPNRSWKPAGSLISLKSMRPPTAGNSSCTPSKSPSRVRTEKSLAPRASCSTSPNRNGRRRRWGNAKDSWPP